MGKDLIEKMDVAFSVAMAEGKPPMKAAANVMLEAMRERDLRVVSSSQQYTSIRPALDLFAKENDFEFAQQTIAICAQ